MNNQLILELFSEEIPASLQIQAAKQIHDIIITKFGESEIKFSESEFVVTPRRILISVSGLPSVIEEKNISKKGPKVNSSKTAIDGFLKSNALTHADLLVIDGFYYTKKNSQNQAIEDLLKIIIEKTLISFSWSKSMRWNDTHIRWIRPLRNILCIFNQQVLPVKFGNLLANDYTFGHRFLAPQQITVKDFAEYKTKLRQAFVILSSQERKEIIINRVEEIATKLKLKVNFNQNLLNEVVGIVEYPNVLYGEIEQKFLTLPREVLISVMKNHQRYFYLEDNAGNLAPYFIFVANVKNGNDELIIKGNERVLKARLSDAEFFYKLDLEEPISGSLAKLAKRVFHHKLGTVFDKTNNIIAIAEHISNQIAYQDPELVKKAALQTKLDLTSEMVGEFPELQGIMGKYYALAKGEDLAVADAIANHYRPIDSQDKADISPLAAIIAIADKIDSIVGLFCANEKPTSSKDPFALRRAALGIIKLIRFNKFNLSLDSLLEFAGNCYKIQFNDGLKEEIIIFFSERLKYYLKAEGFPQDLINATIQNKTNNINFDILRLESLKNFLQNNEAKRVIQAIKRITKILAENEPNLSLEINRSLLSNNIEKELLNKIEEIKPNWIKYLELHDFNQLFQILCSIATVIEEFFTEVLVNDSNLELRQNRLNLLNNILFLSQDIAKFNFIEI